MKFKVVSGRNKKVRTTKRMHPKNTTLTNTRGGIRM